MVLDTPLLRVSRPVAACSRCRAAKVKCDGKLPACTACEKSNRASECSSTNDQFARGKERSYVATLEARVERLEKKITEARARRKSSSILMHDAETATPRRTSVDTLKAPRPVSKRAARRKEALDIDELVSDFGLLPSAVNATARDFYGFTNEMSYARLILSASSKEPLPKDLTKALPPRFAATPLIQHWVNNVFSLLPIFEEASVYASVDAVYHLDDNATAFDHWTVRMVLAIACLSQSEQRGDTLYSDAVGHVNAALEHAEEVLHPGFISSIQALILLVEYATMDPHHFDSWTLIGAASRAMVDLGIHQDPSRSAAIPRAKLEIRRRVYWCVYALDRSTSLVQTRAFSFSDDSAHVGLPFHASVTSPKHSSPQSQVFMESFDTALALFRIREIQSEWYMDLFQSGREPWQDPYPYIWKTYAKMTEWFQDMPDNTLPAIRGFYELELLYSYVYILSPSPRVPHIHEYAQRLIFEHSIAYAASLLAALNTPSNTTKPPVTFYDAMRAYMTGRQFVDVLSRNLDVILNPVAPTPPAPLTPSSTSEDPLAPPASIPPPTFPSPLSPDGQNISQNPIGRAITAVNDFATILSTFGLRFGFTHWRDRFQRESSALLAQLYHRGSLTSQSSPQSQISAPLPPPNYFPQSYIPTTSPQQPIYHQHPTTPPTAYPPRPSPFSTSPYNGNPFATPNQSVSDWTTPSPQPSTGLPDMPQPTDGRFRQARLYGPGLPVPGSSRRGSVQMSDGGEMSGGWTQNQGTWN
ncbi:fungal-specific transcription factor domain-containing protein [Massariosphaeria phaeospora]|uniref:Fungal-specific transcription factor domain-containing protein n=1 Tax=Massariosphaeria phaeospora TaxID=100035 RepID=A0A7C8I2Q6_9PLEO|nr:fungal-specific transcription factor domain-containing protein [Massariosphaeria phaeospora]